VAESGQLQVWLAGVVAKERHLIFKRLSANDTGATGGHQVGLYVPNRFAFEIAPQLNTSSENPRLSFELWLVSHDQRSSPSLIYYNNRRRGGTRNECRITGFGGGGSALQDPESTGAIVLISFDESGARAEAWLTSSFDEDAAVEAQLGPVEPGSVGFLGVDREGRMRLLEEPSATDPCVPPSTDLPVGWVSGFPTARSLSTESSTRVPPGLEVDDRFLRRHDCEYALFQAVEERDLMPVLSRGFSSVGEFLGVAQTTLQRRKARAGRSLELQLARILDEERVAYSPQPETESGHRPDFVLPSIERYRQAQSGAPDLAMLAAKSTLRDRWRQILREADKIPLKHLFTLDHGVSEAQFRDISAAGIKLIVPAALVRSFPHAVRPELLTLSGFVGERRAVRGGE
jgi:hypothetical protein